MSMSAFGVDHEQISKYDNGTITYHHEQAATHSRKKASGGRQVAGGLVVGSAGVAAHLNARDLGYRLARATHNETAQARKVVSHGGLGLAAAGGALATVGAVRFMHHGRKQNKHADKAQAARYQRNMEMAEKEKVAKSAFGVEHAVEKFAIGQALDLGRDALKGVKSGIGGWNEGGGKAVQMGAKVGRAGEAGRVKLKPLVSTPGRAAATAGTGALGTGMILGNRSNN